VWVSLIPLFNIANLETIESLKIIWRGLSTFHPIWLWMRLSHVNGASTLLNWCKSFQIHIGLTSKKGCRVLKFITLSCGLWYGVYRLLLSKPDSLKRDRNWSFKFTWFLKHFGYKATRQVKHNYLLGFKVVKYVATNLATWIICVAQNCHVGSEWKRFLSQ